MTAAARPSRTSVSANDTSSRQMTMSEDATRPRPPARTGPSRRVTTGTGRAAIPRWRAMMPRAASTMSEVAASLRSAPEQNTGWADCRSTPCSDSSAPASASTWASSATSRRDRALRLAGESRVTTAIRSSSCRWTRVSLICSTLVLTRRPRLSRVGCSGGCPGDHLSTRRRWGTCWRTTVLSRRCRGGPARPGPAASRASTTARPARRPSSPSRCPRRRPRRGGRAGWRRAGAAGWPRPWSRHAP